MSYTKNMNVATKISVQCSRVGTRVWYGFAEDNKTNTHNKVHRVLRAKRINSLCRFLVKYK